jgi:uncharacterized protein
MFKGSRRLWSDGADQLLVVCEEAHRYMAADHNVGFGPTRRAISRIAKEGRKYGVFLGLVTQRPAELDSTILSQCSTLFAMRMTNERDQGLLRSAVADTAANFLAFLPSLGTGEAFAFGEGVALPTRMKFRQLPAQLLPKSETSTLVESTAAAANHSLASVVERWRGRVAKPRVASKSRQKRRGRCRSHRPKRCSCNRRHSRNRNPNRDRNRQRSIPTGSSC